MAFDLDGYLTQLRQTIDRALADSLPPTKPKDPLRIREAMSAALLEGGKRLRPCLTLAACQAVGGTLEGAIPAACAVEMVHAYSLVHDDLPALDNDAERRGKPSSHKRFGEAAAILAGDALLTLAFEILSGQQQESGQAGWLQAVHELARSAGARGMVGGQALDLELKGKQPGFEAVELSLAGKTAALFSACTALGGLVGGAGERDLENLRSYGFDFGLAFQHADDLEDATFPAHRERATRRAAALARRAGETALRFGEPGAPLVALAGWLEERIRRVTSATPAGT